MQLTKHIGCLLALVFATASAFAADWFTADLAGVGTSPWSAVPAGWEQVTTGVYKFNDWNNELVYTAATAANTTSSNSVIKTTVKFTAMDKADFFNGDVPQDAPSDAKAGLTIVEDSDANPVTTKFYGIVNGEWAELTGDPADALANAVEVKVEITKGESANYVKYMVGAQTLEIPNHSGEPLVAATENFGINKIAYKGCVPALSALVGFAYGNTAAAKEEVVIDSPGTGVPPTIDYNPADLADRGVDVTSAAAVKEYLTGTRANGLKGWVNTTLGLDDTQTVAVASSACTTKGSVVVEFGFIEDGNSTIQYVVDGGTAKESATIDTTISGIKEVTVKVTQNGVTATLDPVQVGVMNTGKELTPEEKTAKGGEKIFDIVAVPFEAFSGKVTVANVLNTAELTTGDKLYVLRNGQYDTYELDKDGAWEVKGGTAYSRGGKTEGTTPAPSEAELKAGDAIWIERSVDSMIVFTGKGEIDKSHTWTWESGEYSLVANPTVKEFSLYAQTFGTDGDMIIIEDVANPKQFERKDNVWGEWKQVGTGVTIRGKEVTQLVFSAATEGDTNEVKIPAGIGFWYYNAKGKAVTIDFGNNATPVAY